MKVRLCPKCGNHNLENAWSCSVCGETLSMNSLIETEDLPSQTKEPTSSSDPKDKSKLTFDAQLHKARQEQELALQLAKRAAETEQHQHEQIEQAAISQNLKLVNDWKKLVTTLLDETAKATWGEDAYTLIEPDGIQSFTWTAVRVQGKSKLNYQVTLDIARDASESDSKSSEDNVFKSTGFRITGHEVVETDLSEEKLKEALVSVFKSGPKDGDLENYSEGILAKSSYKEGEFEVADWKFIVFPSMTILLSVMGLGSGEAEGFLFGLIGIGIAAMAFSITQSGKRFRRLSTKEKAIVIVACIPGVFACGWVILALVALLGGLTSSADRERRVSEIEDGVKRAIDK